MKTEILDVNGYKVFVETNVCANATHIKFISTFSGAKEPDGEYTKFEIVLDQESLDKLKKAIDGS